MPITLHIGNKNYSSWSLRPWLCLRWAGATLIEHEIALSQPGYGKQAIAEVLAVAPNGRVPALQVDGLVIWDSLAIAEWVAESFPAARLWPERSEVRAVARAAVAEMHSGFACMRRDLSMNILRRVQVPSWPAETAAELARIDALLAGLRQRFGAQGPWLCGTRSIADAFYAPVATRLRTYGVRLSDATMTWCEQVFADADFRDWESRCVPNSWDQHGYSVIDGLYATGSVR
jgi:glutathione S-transferase